MYTGCEGYLAIDEGSGDRCVGHGSLVGITLMWGGYINGSSALCSDTCTPMWAVHLQVEGHAG